MDPVGRLLVRFIAAMLVLCGLAVVRDTLRIPAKSRWIRGLLSGMVIWTLVALLPVLMVLTAGFSGFIPLRKIPEGPAIFLQMWNFSLVLYCLARLSAKAAGFLARSTRWVFGAIRGKAAVASEPNPQPPRPVDQRKIRTWGLRVAVVPLLAVGLSTWAVLTRCNLEVKTVRIDSRGSKDGKVLRLAQVSDLHLGQFFSPGRLAYYLQKIQTLNVDLVVFTGDLINSDNTFLRESLPILRELTRRVPVYACMGNHDHIDDPDEFRALAQEAGITLLQDRRIAVRVQGEVLELAGMEYAYNRADTRRHLERVYRGRRFGRWSVLLAHNPLTLDSALGRGIDLILSGHTHGGQIVFRAGVNSGSLIDLFFPYSRGHYQRDATHLYVNSGLGGWFPLRINCPPEITILELL